MTISSTSATTTATTTTALLHLSAFHKTLIHAYCLLLTHICGSVNCVLGCLIKQTYNHKLVGNTGNRTRYLLHLYKIFKCSCSTTILIVPLIVRVIMQLHCSGCDISSNLSYNLSYKTRFACFMISTMPLSGVIL